jgi:superfamily I DNA and RNA helicase
LYYKDNLFYIQKDIEEKIMYNEFYKNVIEIFYDFRRKNNIPVYILNKVLSKIEDEYSEEIENELENVCVVLIPDYKPLIIKNNLDSSLFEDFKEEFFASINSVADKFNFSKNDCLGKITKWKKFFQEIEFNDLNQSLIDDFKVFDFKKKRKIKILISLIIDSQNEAERICNLNETDSILEKVKKRIRLFDAEQTRFLYNEPDNKKVITIQGLSGSGKTELLLHKIKRFFENQKNSEMVLTCHNKVLAKKLVDRIEDFFDFMGVRNKNKWRDRIYVGNSWGGFYKKICNENNIKFLSFREESDFNIVCKKAIKELENKQTYKKYDYIFIDESQDLPDNFFKLCEMLANKKVYIVGDIFQDIFGNKIKKITDVDFTLKESYRTHPKTLMFSQAIGLGLMEGEDKLIDCLQPDEWESCGYQVNKRYSHKFLLKRENLAIFSDEEFDIEPFEFYNFSTPLDLKQNLEKLIKSILEKYPDLKLGDIAIVVLFKNNSTTYKVIDLIEEQLYELGLNYSVSYKTREYKEDRIFLTNQNNVKGLEFPFVICVSDKINFSQLTTEEIKFRNSLYMTLSRAFLQTYWFTMESKQYLYQIKDKSVNIINNLELEIVIPQNCDEIKTRVLHILESNSDSLSFKEFLNQIYDKLDLNQNQRKKANSLILDIPKFTSEEFQKNRNENEIREFIRNYILV